ncbi:hypothetical protein N1851_012535 [Merluccius polli]|uniref:Uncharacterized protein n=1 Tax=Merluccius polli TaxID=89951 RepID=A0AA47MW67_MERPO|nr:hypothetical protein N1851_012535 [Merluccius polli]
MSFLRRVAGLSLRDRVRSSVIREELGVDPLLLRIERSQMRWLGHLDRMPPWAGPTGRRPRGRPRTRWRDSGESLGWPGNASGSPGKSWTKWLGRGKFGLPCLGCFPRNPTPDKRKKTEWGRNLAKGTAQWSVQRHTGVDDGTDDEI